jgi:hypothetical protein
VIRICWKSVDWQGDRPSQQRWSLVVTADSLRNGLSFSNRLIDICSAKAVLQPMVFSERCLYRVVGMRR